MAITFEASEPMGNLLNQLSSIGSKSRFSETMQLPARPKPKPLGAFSGLQYAPPSPSPGTGVTAGRRPSGPLPGGDLGALLQAIRGQESGGTNDPYRASNPSGALGAYQILWSNIASNNGSDWDRQALGRDVSRDEFLNNPGIQDQIASYKLGQYLKSRGMAGAAATWYGGDWGYKHMYDKTPQNGYPSMYEYVMSILNRAR